MGTEEKSEVVKHDKTNTWHDGERHIPVTEMTDVHLKRAKKYAQRMEEYHWFKSTEFSAKVEMLEEEAERRKIKLPEYRSKYQKSNRRFKEHVANMPEGK